MKYHRFTSFIECCHQTKYRTDGRRSESHIAIRVIISCQKIFLQQPVCLTFFAIRKQELNIFFPAALRICFTVQSVSGIVHLVPSWQFSSLILSFIGLLTLNLANFKAALGKALNSYMSLLRETAIEQLRLTETDRLAWFSAACAPRRRFKAESSQTRPHTVAETIVTNRLTGTASCWLVLLPRQSGLGILPKMQQPQLLCTNTQHHLVCTQCSGSPGRQQGKIS